MASKRTSEKKSIYKNVYWQKNAIRKWSLWRWHIQIGGKKYFKTCFKTEREAALSLDKALIEKGLTPINIFIKR